LRNWNVAAIFSVVLTSCWLTACGGAATPTAEARTARNPLEIAPNATLLSQLELGEPQYQFVTETIRVAGRVEADETRVARVSAPVAGRITQLEAFEGEPVTRGQVMATIYSTDLAAAQSSFLKAWTQRQLEDRAVVRARQLLAAGVIGDAELQRREAELQQASAEYSSSREQLGFLGLSPEAIDKVQNTRSVNSTTSVVSSIDGIVMERKATIGQAVQTVETVFVVADLSRVWLVADVPEQNAGSLKVGMNVEAEIPALPNEKISGVISFVSAIVNPETRTVRTRMNLLNPHRRFKPAMLATITLRDTPQRRLLVPGAAVVREGNDDSVFLQAARNRFLLHRVTLGEQFGDKRVVLEGLKPGEKIVTGGAFHLNNERRRRELGGEGE
jgi:cobalt-zinc-cadmium efflux system membrane fusion protein